MYVGVQHSKAFSSRSFYFAHVSPIHPEGMLYDFVILTLIEDAGRGPLISTNFRHEGSVCH